MITLKTSTDNTVAISKQTGKVPDFPSNCSTR